MVIQGWLDRLQAGDESARQELIRCACGRLERLTRTRGMSRAEAERRIAAQADDARRRAAADVVLDNDGGLDELHAAVDALWSARLVPYERNVREQRVAPGPVVPTEPDPTWPQQYACGVSPSRESQVISPLLGTASPRASFECTLGTNVTRNGPISTGRWASTTTASLPRPCRFIRCSIEAPPYTEQLSRRAIVGTSSEWSKWVWPTTTASARGMCRSTAAADKMTSAWCTFLLHLERSVR